MGSDFFLANKNGKKNKEGRVRWKIEGVHIDSCNCDWGCPCQFWAKPTHGNCDGSGAFLIRRGTYGPVSLDNLSAVDILSFPGAVHEGHGKASYFIDERADDAQFEALSNILTGRAGGGPFEIYASMCDKIREPRRARIRMELNGVKSRVTVQDFVEIELEPIRNRVTHEPYRAIIELPGGFEADRMEQASSRRLKVHDAGFMEYTYFDTYGSVADVRWKGP